MKIVKTKLIYVISMALLLLTACDNQWDDHVEVTNPALSGTVLKALEGQTSLSTFCKMVKETGYDVLLNSDNTFTVLAPTNEALAAYASASKEEKTAIVKNHIAYLTYNAKKLNGLSKLQMLNGKNLLLSDLTISTSNCDVVTDNGIIHEVNKVVLPLKNIYEFLESLDRSSYIQLETLMGETRRTMDLDKSVQTGVNDEGRPIYDTVWTTFNPFFEKMPVMDENASYTFVLIDNATFNQIAGKYAKYMTKGTQAYTNFIAASELVSDLVFNPNTQTALSGVAVDFSKATVTSEYKASNGLVRIMSGVDIKLKENKIKTIYVEGESVRTSLNTKYHTRVRPWARGGYDVMVSGYTQQYRDSLDTEGNQVLDAAGKVITIQYRFNYNTSAADAFTSDINFYLEYGVPVYSANYKMAWVAYDDIASHVGTDGHEASTLKLEQKLFISLPGEAKLRRESTGQISNNYLGNTTAFVGVSKAGVMQESPLQKYTLGAVPAALLSAPVTDEEDPESPFIFTSPTMGEATFFVCNTTRYSGTYSGMMFLDYIRLTPIIGDDE